MEKRSELTKSGDLGVGAPGVERPPGVVGDGVVGDVVDEGAVVDSSTRADRDVTTLKPALEGLKNYII